MPTLAAAATEHRLHAPPNAPRVHDARIRRSGVSCSSQAMGNMSSCSFLWTYDSLMKEGTCKQGEWGLFITMGPGAGIECALWRMPLA